jgi:DNA-binding transcriptional LysR family regulator
MAMKNIPTDLLRTFVTVVDLENCTRAGERIGRTQSAISLQLKRLQELVGAPLFVREAAGGKLTETGEILANYARRILTLNDELVTRLARKSLQGRLQIGLPSDYADHILASLLAHPEARDAGVGFDVTCELSYSLLEGLREGRFDVVVAMTPDAPAESAFVARRERLVWVGRPETVMPGRDEVLRIVASPEGCLYRRHMLNALQREGRPFEIVYTNPSFAGLEAAITAGFGVTAIAESIVPERLARLPEPAGLPALDDTVIGVYLARDERRTSAQALAALLAELVGITTPVLDRARLAS